jgi:hypothetical protein
MVFCYLLQHVSAVQISHHQVDDGYTKISTNIINRNISDIYLMTADLDMRCAIYD